MGSFQEKDLVRILNNADQQEAKDAIKGSKPYIVIQADILGDVEDLLTSVIDIIQFFVPQAKIASFLKLIYNVVAFALEAIEELETDPDQFLEPEPEEEEEVDYKTLYETTKGELEESLKKVTRLEDEVENLKVKPGRMLKAANDLYQIADDLVEKNLKKAQTVLQFYKGRRSQAVITKQKLRSIYRA